MVNNPLWLFLGQRQLPGGVAGEEAGKAGQAIKDPLKVFVLGGRVCPSGQQLRTSEEWVTPTRACVYNVRQEGFCVPTGAKVITGPWQSFQVVRLCSLHPCPQGTHSSSGETGRTHMQSIRTHTYKITARL